MNTLAQELNKVLENTTALSLLSDFGKRFYFPKGIVSQSAEATKLAHRFNATIGMAYEKGKPIILSTVNKYFNDLDSGESVSYASTAGDEELRQLWKKEIIRKNPGISPESISLPVVVPGLTSGIAQISDLFANPGDCVVIPDMFWGNYRLIFQERGSARVCTFPFFNDKGKINIQGLIETIAKQAENKKAIVLLNFPNNPTGYSPSIEEASAITKELKTLASHGFRLLVVSDDAYFGLFYEPETYTHSLFKDMHNLHPNILAVKVDGPTKEDFVWGFRVGFLTFGSPELKDQQFEALNKKLMGALRSSVSNSSKPAQTIIRKALGDPDHKTQKDRYTTVLKERYLKVKEICAKRTKGLALKVLPFNSGYFMSFYYEGGNAEALRKELLLEDGIGTISIQDSYLRIAFASVDIGDLDALYDKIFEKADKLLGKTT